VLDDEASSPTRSLLIDNHCIRRANVRSMDRAPAHRCALVCRRTGYGLRWEALGASQGAEHLLLMNAAEGSASPDRSPTLRCYNITRLGFPSRVLSRVRYSERSAQDWGQLSPCVFRKSYLWLGAHPCPAPSACGLSQVRLAKDRTVPIRRSTYGFCHGDPGEIGRSRIPWPAPAT
jgi:hypothetical protein